MIFFPLLLRFSVCFWVFPNFTKYVQITQNLLFSYLRYYLQLNFSSLSFSLVLLSQAVSELANPELGCCGKNEETSLDLKRRGNHCFRSRDFDEALRLYSKALRVAPLDAIDGDKSLLASLFLNRANVLHVPLFLPFNQFHH